MKPREWYISENSLEEVDVSAQFAWQEGIVHVREVLPDTVTITRGEFSEILTMEYLGSGNLVTLWERLDRRLFASTATSPGGES